MPNLDIKVSYVGPNKDVVIIEIGGYIDTTTAPELSRVLSEQIEMQKYKIIINLEQIDYISSVGWGVFISELKDVRDNGGDIVLTNMILDVYNIFELMEFSTILKSFTGVDNAVAYFLGKEAARPKSSVLKDEVEKAMLTKKVNNEAVIKPEKIQSAPSKVVINTTPTSQVSSYKSEGYDINSLLSLSHTDLGKRIIKIIIDKPYYDIKDIVKALTYTQYGGKKASRWKVKRELKYMGLIDKAKRYEFAMRNRSAV